MVPQEGDAGSAHGCDEPAGITVEGNSVNLTQLELVAARHQGRLCLHDSSDARVA